MSERCTNCEQPVVERDGTWFHDRGEGAEVRWQRACGWAEAATDPASVPGRDGLEGK